MTPDVAILGGQVVDGTGAPPWRADVAIAGDRIAAVGHLRGARAGETVDAAGRLVMPGFVDAHSHADSQVLEPDVQLALLRQGVTTVVTGQDGVGFAPGSGTTVTWAESYFAGINGAAGPGWHEGLTVAQYRAALDRATRVNTAHLVPHGTIRFEVAGPARALDRGQQSRMVRALEQGLADGACGMSTGLDYVPGLYGDADEFAMLGEVLVTSGRPLVTHMRGYEADAWIGLAEVGRIADRSGVPIHVSHLHGPATMLLDLIGRLRDSGADLTYDSYPYLRGFTLVSVPVLPPDLRSLPAAALVDRLADPALIDGLVADWFPTVPGVFDRVTIASAPAEEFRVSEGLTLAAAAAAAGVDCGRYTADLLRATGGAATGVFEQPPTFTDADLRALLRHDLHMGGSDGITLGGRPHPRAWGTFARYLGRHVRDLGDWTWGEAGLHLAGHPARRFGLINRGLLRAGAAADLIIVDPATVGDAATYDDPRRPAAGVDDVWVNGEGVLRAGELTNTLAGRALAPGD